MSPRAAAAQIGSVRVTNALSCHELRSGGADQLADDSRAPACEDLLYIQLQGRAPRAGPGWPPFMRKRRAMAALILERRSVRP